MKTALLGAVVRGLRARALLSVATSLLLALAIGSAVLGPIFEQAVTSSYVVTRLNDAPNTLTGLTSQVPVGRGFANSPAAAVRAVEDRQQALVGKPFAAPQPQLETKRFDALSGRTMLVARPDQCAHLTIRGRCPRAAGEVLMLPADLKYLGVKVGSTLDLGAGVGKATLVGSYRLAPGSTDFWFDPARFVSIPASATARQNYPYEPAPLVTSVDTFAKVPVGRWQVRVDRRLVVPPNWTATDLHTAVRLTHKVAAPTIGGVTTPRLNDLSTIEAEVRGQQASAQRSITPAVLSLVLVALALLLRLLTAASELRVPELALASLRGVSRQRMWVLGLTEPLALVLVSVPLGILVGLGLARLLVRAWLVPGLPVPFPAASVVAGVAVILAATGVAASAVGLVLGVPLSTQLSGVRRPQRSGRVGLIGTLLLVALTVAVVASKLSAGKPGKPDATDLVLPILLAVVAGLAATRAAAAVATWWIRHGGAARLLSPFVASRAISRRREGTLVILPVSAAVAVCVFAAGMYGAAAGWRASVAATTSPAATVWRSPLPLGQTVSLTHRLDPQARSLMATGTVTYPNGFFVAVDAARLARVATWPKDWTPGVSISRVAGLLSPRYPEPLLTGSRVGLRVDNRAVVSGGLYVTLSLSANGNPAVSAQLGPFPVGTTTGTVAAPYCRMGCRLTGLVVGGGAGLAVRMSGKITLDRLTVDSRPVRDAFLGTGWTRAPDASASAQPRQLLTRGSALEMHMDTGTGTGAAELTPGGVPSARPVLLGSQTTAAVEQGRTGAMVSLPDGNFRIDPVLTAQSMPFMGPRGVLIDYRMLTTGRQVFDGLTSVRVLARAGLPPSVAAGLQASGLSVTSTLTGVRHTLDEGAYALALRLYAVVAVLVLLMALAGLAVSTAVQLPARRRDAAALRVVGVSRRTVLAAVAGELVVALGSAAVAGLAAGAFAQLMVVRTVTLGYTTDPNSPSVVPHLDWRWLLGLLVLVLVGLVVASVSSALLTVRGARGATLRESVR
ncbi:MAG: hypothetical protein M3130_03445 [Actinomycetota bacterium]|nr:hypothetical protein [Actinomycetota bacterium]